MNKNKLATWVSLLILITSSFLQPGMVLAEELTSSSEIETTVKNDDEKQQNSENKVDEQVQESNSIIQETVEEAKSYSDEVSNPRITYNANGGSNLGVVQNDQIALGGSYTIKSIGTNSGQLNFVAPNPATQIFDGWNTESDGSGDHYAQGTTVDTWPYSTDTILYAQWASASTLSYDLNGATGTSAPPSKFGKVGTTATIPAIPDNLVLKENTSAAGTWNTKADGSGTDYSPGQEFTLLASNTKLYLKIVANPADLNATLTFDLSGGDATTDTSINNGIKTDINNGYKVTLPATVLTRAGYRFDGWTINGANYAVNTQVEVKYSTVAKAIWTPLVAVTYENGLPAGNNYVVNNMPGSATVVANGSKYQIPTNVPTVTTNDGKIYTFVSWLLSADGTQRYPGGSITTQKNPQYWTMVAQWDVRDSATQYLVSFNGNGGTGTPPYEYMNVNKGETIKIPGKGTLSKSNSTFLGWSNGTTTYSEGDSYTPTGNVTLSASWMVNSTSGAVKFNTQAKSGSNPTTIIGTTGDKITLPDVPADNVPSEDGYTFWGWATSSSATIPDYYADGNYTISTGITTLYGVWSPTSTQYWAQVKISLKDTPNLVLPEGYAKNNVYPLSSSTDTYDFKLPELKNEGYTFKGWSYSLDGKTYSPGETIKLSDISKTKKPGTLTPQWEPITYKVTYSSGDAVLGSVPTTDSISVDYGDSYTVLGNTNSLAKVGYTFIGWTDGTDIYTPGQNLRPTQDIVLSPAWKQNPSGGGGGTVATANIMYVSLESGATGSLPESVNVPANYTYSYTVAAPKDDFIYPGHTFVGWYVLDSKGNEVYYSPGSTFIVSGDMIFYAKWKETVVKPDNSYTISFNGNKNTSGLVPDAQFILDGKTIKMPGQNTLVRNEFVDNNETTGEIKTNSYIFVGWSTNPDAKVGDSDIVKSGTILTPKEDTVYYAVWDLKDRPITLTYDGNGNTNGNTPNNVTDQRYTQVTIDATNSGSSLGKEVQESGVLVKYVFAGWNTKADGTGQDYYSGSKLSLSEDMKLYAKWLPTTSTATSRIIYIGNGNDIGNFIRYEDTNATSYAIKDSGNMKKTGYMFTGWNTVANGSGKDYNPGESIVTKDQSSLVLYAQWKEVNNTDINIVYNGNGNTAGKTPDDYVGLKGSSVKLPSQNDIKDLGMTKTGYMFTGWGVNTAGTGTMYVAGNSYTFNQNAILYAIWAEDGNYIATASKVIYNPNYLEATGSYVVEGAVDATAAVDGVSVLHGHKVVAKEKNAGVYLGEDYIIASYPTTGLPTRANYAFAGWSTDPKATKPDYNAEQIVNMKTTNLELYAVWVPGNYTIKYDANQGKGTMSDQNFTYDVAQNLNENSYTRSGYSFAGWNTEKDGSGTTYSDQANVTNLKQANESLTLYAQWKADEAEIRFDANGGSTKQTSIKGVTDATLDLSGVVEATRDGYSFEGWYTTKDGTDKMPTSVAMPAGGTTYYAHWKANGYVVKYDANKGEGTMSDQAFVYDTAQDLTQNSYTREGYSFNGWNTEKDGSGTSYIDQANVVNLTKNSAGIVTLYAQWVANMDNQILFDANGGTTKQATIIGATDAMIDLSGVVEATRDGYSFEGWYTTKDGSDKMPTSLVMPVGDTTYYAHWKANDYIVKYDANKGEGKMEDQTFTYDVAQDLSENSYTRSGYSFTGWNTEKDGSGTVYIDQANVINLTKISGEAVTLYAQWKANETEIHFDANGGVTKQLSIKGTTDATIALSEVVEATRDGYRFEGWYTTKDGSDKMPTNVIMPAEGITYYAHWQANDYVVKYDANKGAGTMNDQTFVYDIAQNLTENSYTRSGYSFIGWNTKKDGSGTAYIDQANVVNLTKNTSGIVTLYAQWIAATDNQIQFDANGGTTKQATIIGATDTDIDLSEVVEATRDGYSFEGWYTTKEGTEKMPTSVTMPAGGTTYYAHWRANEYVVKYNANQGHGTMNDQTFVYDIAQNLTGNSYARLGYSFTGWNTEKDGSGTSYSNQANVVNLTKTSGDVVTLYAQWKADETEIHFDANGGITTQESIKGVTDTTIDLSKVDEATRDGYSFEGWYIKKDGTEKMPTSVTMPAGGTTYYAHWRANEYVVKYDANQGKGTMNNQTFIYDIAQDLTKNSYDRSGYSFIGWNTEKDGSGVAYSDQANVLNLTKNVDGIITLYAQWVANSDNPIVFDANGGRTKQATIIGATDATIDLSEVVGATRDGYTFEGWYTTKDGTDKMPASVTMPAGGTTYYAHWRANEYIVRYDANQGEGTINDQVFNYDVAQDLIQNSYTRIGYSFIGWNTEKDGSGTSYTDQANVMNLTKISGGLVTLYAQWSANKYVVSYDANKGEGMMDNQLFTYDVPQNLSENSYTRLGYGFAGWNTKRDGTGDSYTDKESVINLLNDSDSKRTLYAQWKAYNYVVKYDINSLQRGFRTEGIMPDQEFVYDVEQHLTKNQYKIPGYTFTGWNTDILGSGKSYVDEELVKNLSNNENEVVTLYAQWEADETEIRFDANGGITTQESIKGVTDATIDLSGVGKATRDGYTFEGWYTTKEGTEKMPTSVTMPAGGTTYYAHWKANEYVVKYNANQGHGTMNDQNFVYDVAQNLTENRYIRLGYSFAGWNTEKDGNGTSYSNQANVVNLTKTSGEVVTLYAQWEADDAAVYFDANGGTTTQKTLKGVCDQTIDLSEIAEATRIGYTFEGWYTTKEGTEKMPTSVTIPVGGVTYYAHWKATSKKEPTDTSTDTKKNIVVKEGKTSKLPNTGETKFFSALSTIVGLVVVAFVSVVIFFRKKMSYFK
ncbi:InlB B-repeat-containing protein [Enterococcus sp. LJL99]